MTGPSEKPSTSWYLVDAGRRVLDGTAMVPAAGTVLDPRVWVDAAALGAIDDADADRESRQRVAWDATSGQCLLVQATVSRDPWRARVVLVDASAAVRECLGLSGAKLIHTVRNAAMAMRMVLDAIAADRPAGAALDEYVRHLREPVRRLLEEVTAFEAGSHVRAR